MQPIITRYRNIEFRSKLEAQWARTLDAFNIEWVYEPEGYELKNGMRYLPDFYLPKSKQFFEVKGIMNDKDRTKITTFENESEQQIYIGEPGGRLTTLNNDDCFIGVCRQCGTVRFDNFSVGWRCSECSASGNTFAKLYDFGYIGEVFNDNQMDWMNPYFRPDYYVFDENEVSKQCNEYCAKAYTSFYGYTASDSLSYSVIKENEAKLFGKPLASYAIHEKIDALQKADIRKRQNEGQTVWDVCNSTSYSNNKIRKIFNESLTRRI